MAYDQPIDQVANQLLSANAYDLFVTYLIDVDSREHLSWQGFEPIDAEPNGNFSHLDDRALLQAYQDTDRILGKLMQRFDQVVVFSDHGMGSLPAGAYQPFYKPDIQKMLNVFNQQERADQLFRAELLPTEMNDYRLVITPLAPAVTTAAKAAAKDWVRFLSHASLASTRTPLFAVTEMGGSPIPAYSIRLATPIHRVDDHILIDGRTLELHDYFDIYAIGSEHMGNGVLALWGKGIKAGGRIENAYEPDVAPTVLYLLGLPITADMDGQPLMQAIREDWLQRHPLSRIRQLATPPAAIVSILRSIRWKRLFGFEKADAIGS